MKRPKTLSAAFVEDRDAAPEDTGTVAAATGCPCS